MTACTWADGQDGGRVWIAALAPDASLELPSEILGTSGLAGEAVLRDGQRVACVARLLDGQARVEIACEPGQLHGARFEATVKT